jgi:BirA family biotin operon repressor/biotin-[acetyl-CoA-carboxylase] ligase
LSFVAAVAVYETVKEYCNNHSTPLELAIKWPNDILINNKKFSGILLEAISIFDKQYIVVGVGINIKYMPSDIPYPVTSLLSEGIVIQDISQVLDKFMINFEYYLSTWKKQGFMYIRQEWMQRAYKLHDIVTIKDGKNRISGEFKDIDFNGAIRIELASGAIYSLSSGELFVTAKCG